MPGKPNKTHMTKWDLAFEIFKVLHQHSPETALNLLNRGHGEFTTLLCKPKPELEELYTKAQLIK